MEYSLFAFGKIGRFLVLFLCLSIQTACDAKNSLVLGIHGSAKYNQLAKTLLTGEIGASLSAAAKRKALEAEYVALENNRSGEPALWHYSSTANGKIIPYPPYQVGSSHCRRYVHSVTINDVLRQTSSVACRDGKGIWVPLT